MYKTIKTIIKFALIIFGIVLLLDLHYQGRSIREMSKDYAWKISAWIYGQGKSLVGKDLKDLTPSSIPKIEKALKFIENDSNLNNGEKRDDVKKSLEDNDSSKDQSKKPETSKSNVTKLDQLTEQDRAKLKELLEQKVKDKPKTSSL